MHDLVCVLKAADALSITAFNLATAGQGNVRSQRLRAFSASEFEKRWPSGLSNAAGPARMT